MEQPLPLVPSPADIRDELQALIIVDLLGPAGAEDPYLDHPITVRPRAEIAFGGAED